MNKTQLLNLLNKQANQPNTKTTRQQIIKVVAYLVKKHIKDNDNIQGINPTRNGKGVNLGEVVEIIIKSIHKNKLVKDSKDYDLTDNGEKVEVKFATSDAYAHEINKNNIVDYYLIITYSKRLGGMVFKIPYEKRNEIDVCHTYDKKNNRFIDRPTINQKAKYLDRELTNKVFA